MIKMEMEIRTILPCSAVPAEKMPPQSATNLSLEGGKTKSPAITMEAQGLGHTNSQTVENPDSFAAVVDSERSLQHVSNAVIYRPIQAGGLAR